MTEAAQPRPTPSGKYTQVSLPVLFASLMVAAMFISSALMIWQGWQAAHRALIHSAEAMTRSMGQLADERVRHFLFSASASVHRLAHSPLRIGPELEQRSSRLLGFINALHSTPMVSAVYTAYENGDFIIAREIQNQQDRATYNAPAKASFMLEVQTKDSLGAPTTERYFYDSQIRFLEKYPAVSTNYDPREREWFRTAMSRPGQYLSAPYPFFTGDEVGLTLSEKAAFENRVVGIDVSLSALDSQLRDLRPTPHAEFAIVADSGRLIARTAPPGRVDSDYQGTVDYYSPKTSLKAISTFSREKLPANRVVRFEVDGVAWFGTRIPLSSIGNRQLNMLIAIPDADLTSTIRNDFRQQAVSAVLITLLLMIASWFIGKRVGGSVGRVTGYAQRLSSFEFSPPPQVPSRIAEFQDMNNVLGEMSNAVRTFLTTLDTMGSEPRLDVMLEKVLHQTVMASGCTFGAVYLLNEQHDALELSAVARGRIDPDAPPQFPHPRLPLDVLTPPHPFIGMRKSGIAQLPVPLSDRDNKPLGLLLLNYPSSKQHRQLEFHAFATQISGALSAAIETRNLVETQRRLFNGFVHLIADAIDAKSPYTGKHCRRVPELAITMVNKMSEEGRSPYGPYHLSEQERYAFRLGAWLHDCGKVTSPEHIIDKATKLEVIHNRIHDVRTRFEVLWRDEEIAHLRRMQAGEQEDISLARRDKAQTGLKDEFAFIARCNIGGEFMDDADIARLMSISGRTWERNFSDRLGLSREEEERLHGIPEAPLPAREHLLADRPEHRLDWDENRPPVEKDDPANRFNFDMELPELCENRGELHNLTIRRGTLSPEDRFRVNDHVVQTFIMLNTLPWPDYLRRVPEIASTHHERMDGAGYPRRLDASRLTLEDRVMAITDVFEALTAADRPYKPAKPLGASLSIMTNMAMEGHLDPLLLRYFLETRLWESYGEHFLRPEQCGDVDIAALVSQLPKTAPPPPH